MVRRGRRAGAGHRSAVGRAYLERETPALRAGLGERGVDVRPGSPDAFAAFLAEERAKWSRAVAESGATVD